MCGIAGFVGEGSRDDIVRMNLAQAWRGPDGSGVWEDPSAAVYLGHCRLAIIDIAGGAQPMWTDDGDIGIVFNGEIYNHSELRDELKRCGARFVTDHSDTEVLLHAYRHWGDGFVRRLNGMWSFAIYDRPRRRLFGSRDRFGKKPFYYLHRPGLFAFASELGALRAHGAIDCPISESALKKFFAYGYIPAPNSILEGIGKLPGGYCLEFDLSSQRLRSWKYWEFEIEPFEEIPADAESRWCEELRSLLDRAVKRRLMSDVPIGAFLSGGIDSSAISAIAMKQLGKGRLRTYSIGFEEPTFDESAYAQRVAAFIGSDHACRTLSIDAARRIVPEVLGRLDEPMGDSSILPTYLLCGFAREGLTVALGGDGGDELFAGYDPFRALRWAQIYRSLVPRPVHDAISLVVSRLPVSHRNMSFDFKVKRTLRGLAYPPSHWCPVWMASLDARGLADLFRQPVDLEDVYSEAIEQWESCRSPALVDRTMQFYAKLYLQDDILTKVDRASMLHSLEVRAPFLDCDLVEFVRRIPWQFKIRGAQTKYLLKKALEPLLPKDILHRPKKGFGVPVGAWFQSGRLAVPEFSGIACDADYVAQRLAAHRAGRSDERAFLWNLTTLAHFVDRARASSTPR